MRREDSKVTKQMCVPSLLGSRGFYSKCVHEVFLALTSRDIQM
jgi:hypothetical protein